MSLNQSLIAEFKQEMATTRKILSLVPLEKSDWKPHEKSMTMGRLAKHLAELPTWVGYTLNYPELDFAKPNTPAPTPVTSEELISMMDKNLEVALNDLNNATDEKMNDTWTLRNGAQIFFTLPKKIVLRSFVFSHNIHHRAQLGVYLRLLNIPIPGSYGPSADDSTM